MPNVYEIVTSQIIAALESGVAPWQKPWTSELPCNLISQKQYRGINTWLLAMSGYSSRYWLTLAPNRGQSVRAPLVGILARKRRKVSGNGISQLSVYIFTHNLSTFCPV